jgi:RNA polymerase sigma factor (sigma-70 family)
VNGEALFLSSLSVIEEAVAHVCRKHRLSATEAEDFAGEVRLRLIDHDYEPLRRFEGRSTLRTYLTVVITRYFLDYRNRLWGKWRPSAEAKRCGNAAMLFERLQVRDGWTTEQALEIMRTNHGLTLDEQTIERIGAGATRREPSRTFAAQDEAEDIESRTDPPETNVVRAEASFLAKRTSAAVDAAWQTLGAEEKVILRMRFEDDMSVAAIAAAMHLDQKRLYRTIDRLLLRLRRQLEADGISKDEIAALFASGTFVDDPAFSSTSARTL